AFRLDLLKQARRVIDRMAADFGDATSGLRRLHESGVEIQGGPQYGRLLDLLDYESRQSELAVTLNIGADGEVKDLVLHDLRENEKNPFYTSPWRRLLLRVKSFFHGYQLSQKVIVQHILRQVFQEIAPALVPLVQMLGHLEVYLASLAFRERMEAENLPVSLATVEPDLPVRLRGLFNPLLLAGEERPVACDVGPADPLSITIVTGPNSGGKTRLLQGMGLAQLLGQSGLYVPAAEARLPLVRGMFVSLVETETAHQAEGRLGREMMRIRSLFASMGSPSLVILDELCSGTNPREGEEIFDLVLRMLDRLGTVAFISTHFLEFAKRLETERPIPGMKFLRVESNDDLSSTYQFLPGVAETSLAAATAERLGVTFEALSELIDGRPDD
ncbi:MAG: DNA mismatch repair protein, partial [Acidobacteriota bacterium]